MKLFLLCLIFASKAGSQNTRFLDSLLKTNLTKYAALLNEPAKYKLQVYYTRIDRDKNNAPHFSDYSFHPTGDYVYPASTVKLPLGLLALMKLEQLNKPGLSPKTAMLTDSSFYCRQKFFKDSSSASGFPTVENYIKKMFLVSDNAAFARTFEFVGGDEAQKQLKLLGYEYVRLLNRLDANCAGDTGMVMPPVYFLKQSGDTVYKQAQRVYSPTEGHPVKNSGVGRFHSVNGRWLPGPKDFSKHNYLEMADLHKLMKSLVFNNFADQKSSLPISNESRLLMLKALGQYPRESDFPRYQEKIYYDSFKKYFMYGAAVEHISQDSIRVMNIVGRAYGFLIDCAYVVDLKNNVEFLLTASVYVNKSGRVGSGKYEYDQLGLPFLKELGLCVYQYERQRKKEFEPDLGEFRKLFMKP